MIRKVDTGYVERSAHRSDCIVLPAMGINYTPFQFEQPPVNKVNLWTSRECLPLWFPLLNALYGKMFFFFLVGKCLRSLIHARAKADVKFILINGKCLTRKRKWKPKYLLKNNLVKYLFFRSCDFSLLFIAAETSYHKLKKS